MRVYVCVCVYICIYKYADSYKFIHDPYPGSNPELSGKSDPDPGSDPKNIIPDPQHCWDGTHRRWFTQAVEHIGLGGFRCI